MQQQLIEAQKKSGNLPGFLMDNQEKPSQSKSPAKAQEPISEEDKPSISTDDASDLSSKTAAITVNDEADEPPAKPKVPLAGEDAKLVAVIATFLNVHPFGAGTDYIWSYLLRWVLSLLSGYTTGRFRKNGPFHFCTRFFSKLPSPK